MPWAESSSRYMPLQKKSHVALKIFESFISPSNSLFALFSPGIHFHRWDVFKGFSVLAETTDDMEVGHRLSTG